MPMCSYCCRAATDDCSSWSEAQGCCGVTGPDDPLRLARKAVLRRDEARETRAEADRIEAEAAAKVAHLRAYADRVEDEAERIAGRLADAA